MYRPVENSGVLSNFNHEYIFMTKQIDWSDGTSEFEADVVEGLPQFSKPRRPPTYWGALMGWDWYYFNVYGDTRDDKDHPATDRVVGGVNGGINICEKAGQIENEAPFPGGWGPYDPTGNLFGHNSNWLASVLLHGVGLNLGIAPQSPGAF